MDMLKRQAIDFDQSRESGAVAEDGIVGHVNTRRVKLRCSNIEVDLD